MSLNLMTYNKDDTARAARTAVQILNSRHQNLGDEPFMQQKAIDLTDMFGPIMDAVTAFVALVAGISLVVGGIGVMNIMLVDPPCSCSHFLSYVHYDSRFDPPVDDADHAIRLFGNVVVVGDDDDGSTALVQSF